MHLYLLTETVNIDISEITLEGGHAPVISSRPGFKGGFKELDLSIEPAVWFKVLVVDAISIDCIRRHISWNSISGVELDLKGCDSGIGACGSYCSTDDVSRLTKSISDSPFDCGEFYAYDQDLDEVFDTVHTLVYNYQLNDLSKDEFHLKLMHLLHVYILPNIRLGCEDIDNVSKSLKQQDNLLQEMDRQILRLSENLQKWRNDLKEQRKKFVEEILNFSTVKHRSCPKDFVGVLAEDVTSDVSEAWESFEKMQKEVDRYKLLPLSSSDSKLLQIQRSKRDELYRKFETFTAVRDKLREIQNSKESFMKKLPKVFENDAHQESVRCGVYMCLKKGEEEKLSEIRALTDRKLLMLSVKEAMWTTLDELTKGKESFGVGMDPTGSAKATDVLNGLTTSAAWQTLAERVARVFATAQNSLTHLHFKFCAEVNASCLRLIEDGRVLKRSSSQSTLCMCSSGQRSSTSERSSSLGSLDISAVKHEQQPLIHPSGDWMRFHHGRDSRDSAVSENSCHSVDSRHNSAVCACDSPVKNRDSAQSGLSVSSENSICDVIQGQSDAKKKKKKFKIKRKTPKSAKATFHSCVTDGQQTGSPGACDGPATLLSPRDGISNSRTGIELLLEQVRQHFDTICMDLQTELDLTPQRYFRKIWLNYESHFYQETIDSIVQLYEFEYGSTTEELCRLVRTLTVADLSLEDALLSHMLQDVETEESSPSDDSKKQVEQSSTEIQGENPFAKLLRNKTKVSPPKLSMSQSAKLPSEKNSTLEEFSSNASEDVACGVDADSSVCVLRQHLSALPQRPKTIRLSLSVRHPKFGDIMYERMLCPVRNSVLVEGSAIGETTCDLSALTEGDLSSPCCDSNTSGLPKHKINVQNPKCLLMKPKYKKQFALAFRCVDIAVSTRCPSVKCQHLIKCLREVSHQISNFYQELYDQSVEACSDQLMDALIILLCNIESSLLHQLYSQLMMLADIIPPFFDGSPFCFTLVQFVGACQFIHERVLVKKNRKQLISAQE